MMPGWPLGVQGLGKIHLSKMLALFHYLAAAGLLLAPLGLSQEDYLGGSKTGDSPIPVVGQPWKSYRVT